MYTEKEKNILKKLNTPLKVQEYLDKLGINFESDGVATCSSPRTVMKRKTVHCIEGAVFAAAALQFNGEKCWLMDLMANKHDYDHVICVFKKNGKWGAISKSNHSTVRYRDPVYSTPRELAMSYFHEYVDEFGRKNMRSFSIPISLDKLHEGWQISEDELWSVESVITEAKHINIVPKGAKLRKADPVEIESGYIREWSEKTGKKVKFEKRKPKATFG